jgi:TRAP-type uncharacterized transport system substrate-binding protein
MPGRSRWLLACVFAPLFTVACFAQTPPPAAKEPDCSPLKGDTLVLRTATSGLYYDLVGQSIALGFHKQKANDVPDIEAVCSLGSAKNVRNLSENWKTTPFAIVQSDVAHAEWYGHPRLDACPGRDHPRGSESAGQSVCNSSELGCARPTLITPLYIEAIHVLIRPHLNISSLQDLKGRKLWAGSVGSGARFSAERILSAAGVPFCDLTFIPKDPKPNDKEISQTDAMSLLGEMAIDAMVFSGPVPTHALEDALDQYPEIHFYSLPYDLVQKLTLDESYTEALIRAEDYGKPESTLTVGVEALLMTNDRVPPKQVRSLADFIHNNGSDLREALRDLLGSTKAKEHDGEVEHLRESPQTLLRRLQRWHYFKSKSQIEQKVRKAIDSGSGGEHLHLTFDEKEALKDYMENEEAQDGVAQLPLLDLPTRDSLVPDFYTGDPTIREYFSRPRSATWIRQLTLVLAACFVVLASLFVWMRRKLHRVLVQYPDVVLATIATVLVWTLGSYLLYHYEALVNEDFNPLWKSFGSIFWYFIPFFGRTALTPSGQTTILVLKGLGVFLVGGFLAPLIRRLMTADLVAPFISWLQGRPLMQKDITGHIVIINWDERGREIVRRLMTIPGNANRGVAVVTPGRVDFTDDDLLTEVVSVVCDATQVQCLKKARIPFAHSVTILSVWKPSDPHDRRQSVDRDVADTKTIQSLRAIRDLCATHEPPVCPVVTAEIQSASNRQEAERAGGDVIHLEVVCVDALGNDVLIQSALNPGVATLYTHLMSTTGNGAPNDTEISRITAPRELLGKSFGEMLDYFSSQRRGHCSACIPIGVCRASQVFLNPSDEKLGRLQEGDALFVITERRATGKSPARPTAHSTGA